MKQRRREADLNGERRGMADDENANEWKNDGEDRRRKWRRRRRPEEVAQLCHPSKATGKTLISGMANNMAAHS